MISSENFCHRTRKVFIVIGRIISNRLVAHHVIAAFFKNRHVANYKLKILKSKESVGSAQVTQQSSPV